MNSEERIDNMLRKIAKSIEISQTEFEQAKTSYEAVGKYLDESIPEYDIRITPQGSLNLGTATKTTDEEDVFDIDLVAIVKGNFSNAADLKNVIGDALKKSKIYSKKIEEGKRCWTVEYSNYHMDILPAMESDTYSTTKELIMTNKENEKSNYEFRTTNPEAYKDWFIKRMEKEKRRLKEEYAFNNKVDIEAVPEYETKTTLQIAIELLKRYRDQIFKENMEIKPISIIITTLVAEIYTGNETVYELICKFSRGYKALLEKDADGNILIRNPVNKDENFADKWITNPERQEAFFKFMDGLERDLVKNTILSEGYNREQAEVYKKLFGKNAVSKAYESIAEDVRAGRENSEIFVKPNGNITREKTNIKVKDHTFYGE